MALLERQERLTTIDYFAKNCWAVGGRAIPAAVAELPLALLYGSVQPSCDGMQDARILPNQPALATTQQGQAWIQDQLHILGIGEEVGRGGHIDNTPVATEGQRKSRSNSCFLCIYLHMTVHASFSWHMYVFAKDKKRPTVI